jgi:8-oxo-dGTP diphosphatase
MKIVAKALITDNAGRILVLRRSSTHPRFAHHLDFPGGEVEQDESESEAVAREILEESGLQIPPASLELAHQRQMPDETTHLIFRTNLAVASPRIILSWEHDEHEWITPAQLLKRPAPSSADSFYETILRYLARNFSA